MQSYAKATGSNWCVLWWRNFDHYMTLTHMLKQLALIDVCCGDATSIITWSRQIDTYAIIC